MNAPERATSPARTTDARSPFMRLADLLGDTQPGMPPINISVGEPQHPVPPFVAPILAKHTADFGRYPGNAGTDRFRQTVAGWLNRRYALPRPIEPLSEVLVLGGSREGLFLAAIAAKRFAGERPGKPAILVPNPFYAPYSAGAVAAECEPVYLDATAGNGFLPDLDALSNDLLARTVAFYLASPANPQGSVASRDYLARVAALAQKHNFMLFADECYSEIYWKDQPVGVLEDAGQGLRQRRRVQLALEALEPARPAHRVRGGRQALHQTVPRPARGVGPAGADPGAGSRHRRLYRRGARRGEPGALSRQIRPRRPDPRQPLRLQAPSRRLLPLARRGAARRQRGRGAEALEKAGLRVLPGKYAARRRPTASIAGENYIRVAMVQNRESPPRRCIGWSQRCYETILPAIRYTLSLGDMVSDDCAPPRAAACADRRHRRDRHRRHRGARARHLVGAGPLVQPRHQCAGAQRARASSAPPAPT